MSYKCYDIAFKLRVVAGPKGKSKEVTPWEIKMDATSHRYHYSHKSHVPLLTTFWSFTVNPRFGLSEVLEEGSHWKQQTAIGPCTGPNFIPYVRDHP